MHPFLNDIQKLSVYLAGWLVIALLFVGFLSVSGGMPWFLAITIILPLLTVYAFVCLSAWYICRAFPIHKYHILQILGVFIVTAVISSSLWIGLANGWMWIIEQSQLLETPQQLSNFQPRQLFGFGIVLYLLASAVYYLIITFETSREAERRTLQAKLHANEAELRALRAQIDPHFLFNSLNSVSALIMQKPESAREMCTTLSDFFRKSLQYGEKDLITLEEELSLIKHFLSIEQIRFGKRLSFVHNVDEAALPCLLPPLILQPLIENCINHGIKHLIDGGTINVQVSRSAVTLKISVENPFDPEMPASKGSGIGLENVKRRLRTLYGNDVSIDIIKNINTFRVDLILPATQ